VKVRKYLLSRVRKGPSFTSAPACRYCRLHGDPDALVARELQCDRVGLMARRLALVLELITSSRRARRKLRARTPPKRFAP
jgi:hypothetical protein